MKIIFFSAGRQPRYRGGAQEDEHGEPRRQEEVQGHPHPQSPSRSHPHPL